jgi:hypothetical protein
MKRSRTVAMGRFALEALAGEGEVDDRRVSAALMQAVRLYLTDRGLGRPGWKYPAFLPEQAAAEDVVLELSADESLWRALEEEAERQGVSFRQMLEHAALYFAVELSTGRATERIVESLEAEAEPGRDNG